MKIFAILYISLVRILIYPFIKNKLSDANYGGKNISTGYTKYKNWWCYKNIFVIYGNHIYDYSTYFKGKDFLEIKTPFGKVIFDGIIPIMNNYEGIESIEKYLRNDLKKYANYLIEIKGESKKARNANIS